MDDWVPIPGFHHKYSVSRLGDVRNDRRGSMLRPTMNQGGIVYIGLKQKDRQIKRALARLVADAFLPDPPTDFFDTPIHLDGDPWNNRWDNLAWRPRWFAVKYKKQFNKAYQNRIWGFFEDVETGQGYSDSYEIAIRNGLLENEVVLGILNKTPVWPTYQEFRVLPR